MAFMCLIVIIASSSTSDMQLSQFVPKLFVMGLTNATKYATNHFNHYPTMSKPAVLLATLEKVAMTFPDWYRFTSTGGCLRHNLSFSPS